LFYKKTNRGDYDVGNIKVKNRKVRIRISLGMCYKNISGWICLVWLLGFSLESFGQRIFPRFTESYTSAGIQLSSMHYFGDLNPTNNYVSTELGLTRPAITLSLSRKFSDHFHLRADLSYGQIRGDDFESADPTHPRHKFRYARNLHFRNNILEFALIGVYDIFASKGSFLERRRFTPYILAGAAVFNHNPQAKTPIEQGNNWVDLQPIGTEGQHSGKEGYAKPYSLIQPAIIGGIGARWNITNFSSISFEIALRYTFFDHLDDVSGLYPDMGDLQSDLARAMSTRGLETQAAVSGSTREPNFNPAIDVVGSDGNTYTVLTGYGERRDKRGEGGFNDIYVMAGFRFEVIINKTAKRPRFRRRR